MMLVVLGIPASDRASKGSVPNETEIGTVQPLVRVSVLPHLLVLGTVIEVREPFLVLFLKAALKRFLVRICQRQKQLAKPSCHIGHGLRRQVPRDGLLLVKLAHLDRYVGECFAQPSLPIHRRCPQL